MCIRDSGLRDGLRPPTPNRRVLEGIYPLTFPGRYGVPASNPEPVVTGNAGAAGCVSSAPDFSVQMCIRDRTCTVLRAPAVSR